MPKHPDDLFIEDVLGEKNSQAGVLCTLILARDRRDLLLKLKYARERSLITPQELVRLYKEVYNNGIFSLMDHLANL